MKTGIELISEERQRQIDEEKFDDLHDSRHVREELALAAACYATPITSRTYIPWLWNEKNPIIPIIWPFDKDFWKPTPSDRIRELQKAGALIAAEIDRIQSNL